MDYDRTTIAKTYDAARGYSPEVLRLWLDLVAAAVPRDVALIVDVGCGTGRFSRPLAERFDTRVIGIDPSQNMLEIARNKANERDVEFVEAAAEAVPLPDGCADVVFMSMILHHLVDRARAAQECRRLLRPGGCLCVRNSTRDSRYPQRRFFPGIGAMIERELPSRDDVVALFKSAGLRLSTYRRVAHPVASSWAEFADKLALRADSFLARLPAAEFARGMIALRAHAAGDQPQRPVIEDVHWFVFD